MPSTATRSPKVRRSPLVSMARSMGAHCSPYPHRNVGSPSLPGPIIREAKTDDMTHLGADAKIFLVGFMGTGKTTLGRLLAERLAWGFQDLDEAMETLEGESIPSIFSGKGEPYFRALESRVLRELAGHS